MAIPTTTIPASHITTTDRQSRRPTLDPGPRLPDRPSKASAGGWAFARALRCAHFETEGAAGDMLVG